MHRFKEYLAPTLLLTALFSAVAYLVYQQLYTSSYESDTPEHIIILLKLFYGSKPFYIAHPLWHFCVWAFAQLLHISIQASAVFVSAFLVVVWTALAYMVVRRLTRLPSWTATLVTAGIVIVGPLCIPWYNHIIFYGQGSPNVWHNVTLWTVKPFALLTTFYTVSALHDKRTSDYLIAFGALVISIFAKPSFVIMFLPALFFFALLKKIYAKEFVVFFAASAAVSVALLAYQYLHTFGSQGESRVIVDFLGVWSLSSRNIAVSIALALAFPLLFVALYREALEDDYLLLSWLLVFVGIFYYATFAQTGRYYAHGNFGWSYDIAMSLLYLFSIVKFVSVFKVLRPWKRYSLLSLLLIQSWIGLYYFVKILEGQNPLYVSIFL